MGLWRVIGGADRGGILVREGLGLQSPEAQERLGTGALVEELERAGDRLRFRRREGHGPETGWVSVRLRDKELLKPAEGDEVPTGNLAVGRRLRVLGLHGGGSNSRILDKLLTPLHKCFGQEAEWDYVDGSTEWTMEVGLKYGDSDFIMGPTVSAAFLDATGLNYHDVVDGPGPLVEALARGEPYKGWFTVSCADRTSRDWLAKLNDPSVEYTYDEQAEKNAEKIMEHLASRGPFDVLLSFSNASVMTHLVTGMLRERGMALPWQLSVMFNPFPVRDKRFHRLVQKPFDQRALLVYGRSDWAYNYGRHSVPEMYNNHVILEHEEGHSFPMKQPAAKQIFASIAEEMRKLS